MKKQGKNYKMLIIGLIMGVILTSTVAYAATVLGASSVSYNNSSSKLSSTTVQGAIDEIYNNATGGNIVYNNKNIVGAYLYDPDKCKTGDEVTCRKTACPNNSSQSSCPAGTIIKYKVNDSTEKIFNVLHDDTETLTLQQIENTVASTQWYSSDDNTKGPLTALQVLESATAGWSNVNTLNYEMGTTVFNGTNSYSGCSVNGENWDCTTNTYTLGERRAKARMITGQEAIMAGCKFAEFSCSNWMRTGGGYYWTMSAHSGTSNFVVYISTPHGRLNGLQTSNNSGARAVVVISK